MADKPFIIRNEPQPDGTILVTWALPGLRTATVRVPITSWHNGGHVDVGRRLAAMLANHDLQNHRLISSVPD